MFERGKSLRYFMALHVANRGWKFLEMERNVKREDEFPCKKLNKREKIQQREDEAEKIFTKNLSPFSLFSVQHQQPQPFYPPSNNNIFKSLNKQNNILTGGTKFFYA